MTANDSNCSDCRSYWDTTEFGHDECLKHRPRHTRWGYVPANYSACATNRRAWEPMSSMM